MGNIRSLLLAIFTLFGWAITTMAQLSTFHGDAPAIPDISMDLPYDAINDPEPDSLNILDGITIEAVGRKTLIRHPRTGLLELKSAVISEMPTVLGGGDMLSVIRSMGPVSTASELTASFILRGLPTGSTLYTSNGVRMGNPLHQLGLYSVYVPGLYDTYLLDTFPNVCLVDNTSAGVLGAFSETVPDTVLHGSACIGLIESHANVNIPISRNHPTSLAIALRTSYLDKVFPGLLKAGTSELGYSFTDGGVILKSDFINTGSLTTNLTYSYDNLSLHNDRRGQKDGTANWMNLAGRISFQYTKLESGINVTYFKNSVGIEEGFHKITLPSFLIEPCIFVNYTPNKSLIFHLDSHVRKVSGQINTSADIAEDFSVPGKSTAFELNAAISCRCNLASIFHLDLGLRISGYSCNYRETSYSRILPQPRLAFEIDFPIELKTAIRYSRLVRFDRLVEESTMGFPLNFFINCCKDAKYEDNNSIEIEFSGVIPGLLFDWTITGYYIRMRNAAEYGGGLLNFLSVNYDPLADIHYGKGYSTGCTITMMRQFGNVRGRLNYTIGKSRVLIPYFSSAYFPSSSDRTHDLSVNLTWQFLKNFTLASNFTYATGTPYTMAKYGYIIGENLICEYYPHNSSRLPTYKRLDLSLSYRLIKGYLTHEFNVSFYNALASNNLLYMYHNYSIENGLYMKASRMHSIIPSVSYTLSF